MTFFEIAGNMISNKCPRYESCGTKEPYWTDEEHPKEVGEAKNITAYMSISSRSSAKHAELVRCKYASQFYNRTVQVVRCSWETNFDFVYRYIPREFDFDFYEDFCSRAFCSMTGTTYA